MRISAIYLDGVGKSARLRTSSIDSDRTVLFVGMDRTKKVPRLAVNQSISCIFCREKCGRLLLPRQVLGAIHMPPRRTDGYATTIEVSSGYLTRRHLHCTVRCCGRTAQRPGRSEGKARPASCTTLGAAALPWRYPRY